MSLQLKNFPSPLLFDHVLISVFWLTHAFIVQLLMEGMSSASGYKFRTIGGGLLGASVDDSMCLLNWETHYDGVESVFICEFLLSGYFSGTELVRFGCPNVSLVFPIAFTLSNMIYLKRRQTVRLDYNDACLHLPHIAKLYVCPVFDDDDRIFLQFSFRGLIAGLFS